MLFEFYHSDIPHKYRNAHIGVLEMMSIFIALRLWHCSIINKRIRIMCDNQSVLHVLNSGRGKDIDMLHLARQIMILCARNNAEIRLVYIESKENILADSLSRWNLGSSYKRRFYQHINNISGSFKDRVISNTIFDDSDYEC